MDLTEFLEHHGIKGQKWGVRRRSREGHLTKFEFNKRNEDRKAAKAAAISAAKSKKAHELSDEELKKAVARMNMEKQYNSLITTKKGGSHKALTVGAAFATGILGQVGKNMASAHVQKAATDRVGKAVAQQALRKSVKGTAFKLTKGPGFV